MRRNTRRTIRMSQTYIAVPRPVLIASLRNIRMGSVAGEDPWIITEIIASSRITSWFRSPGVSHTMGPPSGWRTAIAITTTATMEGQTIIRWAIYWSEETRNEHVNTTYFQLQAPIVAGLTAKSPLRDQQQQLTNISNNQQQLSGSKGVIQGERHSVGGTRIIGMIKK